MNHGKNTVLATATAQIIFLYSSLCNENIYSMEPVINPDAGIEEMSSKCWVEASLDPSSLMSGFYIGQKYLIAYNKIKDDEAFWVLQLYFLFLLLSLAFHIIDLWFCLYSKSYIHKWRTKECVSWPVRVSKLSFGFGGGLT